MGNDPMRNSPAGAGRTGNHPARNSPAGAGRTGNHPARNTPAGAGRAADAPARDNPAGADGAVDDPGRGGAVTSDRVREWALLGEWLSAPPPLHDIDVDVVRERLGFVGRARASLAALEAELVSEVARREGDAAAEEILRRDQKRSRTGARKAVKTAAQLEWAPNVAEKLAAGAITPEAARLILDAEGPVDQRQLLAAAEEEPEDRFRRTLKEHINERTSEAALNERRARQRQRRRASISEQSDGMFHLFAQLDPLTGAQVRAALLAKSDGLFRNEDPKQRSTPPQRFADALAGLVCNSAESEARGNAGAGPANIEARGGGGAGPAETEARGGAAADSGTETRAGSDAGGGGGVPPGFELIVLADYDLVHERIINARLTDGTRLTEAETLAVACDAKILPGIFNKHTGNILLGRSQRKVPKRLRKQLIARDGGCIGCGAHQQICEVHHIVPWTHGGETTYENTCLLCWRCHHIRVHLHGEEITRHPDGTLTLAPPVDIPPDHPADPAGDDRTDRREPRTHEPGQRREHHRQASGHRRGPPDTPGNREQGCRGIAPVSELS